VSHDRSPIKQVLDLAFFGPVGLALAAKDAIPDWVVNGRNRVGHQVGIAKMVGEHASRHGQKVVSEALVSFGLLPGPPPPDARATAPVAQEQPMAAPETRQRAAQEAREDLGRNVAADDSGHDAPAPDDHEVATDGPLGGAGFRLDPAPLSANGGHGVSAADGFVLDSAELAIPGYDSLSASQVVQRLAGLAPPELEAVRTYEAAGRGRRTILTKIAQLQTGRS
jgi:hypothetical protein